MEVKMELDTNELADLVSFLRREAKSPSPEFRAKAIEKFGEDAWNRYVERKRKFNLVASILETLG